MSSRAVKSFVGIAAVVALAFMLWRAELLGFKASMGSRGETDASHSPPVNENAETGLDSGELAPASDPARNARAELASLTGTLKVSGEDLPLAGFLITMVGGLTHPTDTAGVFEFHGLAPGTARLRVDTGGPFEPLERSVELSPGLNRVELRLVPLFELSVVVVEQAGQPGHPGQPIASARVRIESAQETAAFFQRGSASVAGSGETDSGGHCVLAGLPAGDFALVAQAEGHIPTRVPVSCWYRDEKSRARPRSVLLALSASSAVVRGRVKGPDRQAQEGALVCLDTSANTKRTFTRAVAGVTMPSPPYTFTDAEGAFELPRPDDALEVALIVCGRDPRLSPIARRVVSHEDLERDVAIELEAARPIELTVVASDKRVVQGCLKVSDGELAYDLVSDPVLASIPGFVDIFCRPSDVLGHAHSPYIQGNPARLSLPDGGYEVRFEDGAGALGSWFIRVGANEPDRIELRLP